MENIRPAIKEMSDMDLVMLISTMKNSEDPSDIQFRKELLLELKNRQQAKKK